MRVGVGVALQDLLIKVGDFIYDGHYIHSPEFTIW